MARPGRSEQILVAAERLFAQHGLDGVSYRQIVAAAGLRNHSAIQYHFESKAGLVRAIVEYRVKPFNARRIEIVEELDRTGRSHDLRGLVEAIVLPLVELEPTHVHFVLFLARLHYHPELTAIYRHLDPELGLGGHIVSQRMHECLQFLPPPIRENRFNMAMNFVLQMLAGRQQRIDDRVDDGLDARTFVDDLLSATVGLLSAPHVGETPTKQLRARRTGQLTEAT
jgi:AcrR family transcriptional regulator